MNEPAKGISELMSGDYGKTVVIAGKVYMIKAPAINVIIRSTKYLSEVGIPEGITTSEMMSVISKYSKNIVKGLSYLIVGDVNDYETEVEKIAKKLQSGTHEELCNAFLVAFELIAGRSFFQCASWAMELAKQIAKPK